jgi:SAM-dependent methyltransferase
MDADSNRDECIAAHYAFGRPQLSSLVAKRLVELLTPMRGANIVDFGCGPGRLLRLVSKFHLPLVGIDISRAMLERARESTREVRDIHLTAHLDEYFTRWHTPADPLVLSQSFHLIAREQVKAIISRQDQGTRTAVIWMNRLPDADYFRRCCALFREFHVEDDNFDSFYSHVRQHACELGVSFLTQETFEVYKRFEIRKLASYLYSISYVHDMIPPAELSRFFDRVHYHFRGYHGDLRLIATLAVFQRDFGQESVSCPIANLQPSNLD